MEPQTVEQRVERLEARVTVLEELPARLDALALQISQFRDEMRAEFSAMRSDLREEIHASAEETKRTLREEIRAGDEETRRVLLEKIEETRRHATMLHEDTLSRIAATQEGKPRPRKRR